MAAKPRFRIRVLVFGVIATGTASLAFASASLADTGSVYFDSNDNTAPVIPRGSSTAPSPAAGMSGSAAR